MSSNDISQYGSLFLKHANSHSLDGKYFEDRLEHANQITYTRPIIAIALTALVLVAAVALGVLTALNGYQVPLPSSIELLTSLGNYNFIIAGITAFVAGFVLILASRELYSRRAEREEILEVEKAQKIMRPFVENFFESLQIKVGETPLFTLQARQFKYSEQDHRFYYRDETAVIHVSKKEPSSQEKTFLNSYFECLGYTAV